MSRKHSNAPKLPHEFASWKECRDYYSLEAIFRGQLMERNPSDSNKRSYKKAARLAMAAEAQRAKGGREP